MKTARPGSPVAAADHRHSEAQEGAGEEDGEERAEAEEVEVDAVVDEARSATRTCRAWRTITPTARGSA
jgi:hypothetical protein